ncbi:hypothetical protein E2C01_022298 [Portunus trituberculatus]|uniref:RNase H type-1 domain-containing protein n=1 Tax=Portunus trituberculatus TaxID=210409 RepID=A0A5B7E519_PORTR|nr:hypothetical protein [Portunus trituberculatus]
MLSKTGLVPLSTQVEQIMACCMSRVLQHDAEGMSQRRLQLAMTQGAMGLLNLWLLQSVLTTHCLTHTSNGPDPQLELPSPTHRTLAPWPDHGPGLAVHFTITPLPAINPDTGRTGAATITSGTELCDSILNHCSTPQTELVAIQLALEHAQHRQKTTVVLHMDSKTGLQIP